MQLPIVGQKIKISAASRPGHDHVGSRMRSMIDLTWTSTRRDAFTAAPVHSCLGTGCDSAALGHHNPASTRGHAPRTLLHADPIRRPRPRKEAVAPR